MNFQKDRFKTMTGTEIYLTLSGYPDFLGRRETETIFPSPEQENVINLKDSYHVSKNFKEKVKLLADPKYLPKRHDLYEIWPWLSPHWEAPVNPAPPPPMYPITWWYFLENPGRLVYELLTDEYVSELARYLGRRSNEMKGQMLKILEIGSGNGRLSHFLREKFDEFGFYNIEIIPSDTGAWEVETVLPVAKVESTPAALHKYTPDLVLCCWMIPETDLSADFRKCPSVQEYVLIAPPNGSIAGESWGTWGFSGDSEGDAGSKGFAPIPPYIIDGFQRFDLKYLSLFQLAQNYGPYFQFGSRTISFRRMPKDYKWKYTPAR